MPKKALEGPKSFGHPTICSALADTVEARNVIKIPIDSNESRISMDGHDKPRIYKIQDHTPEVILQPSVLLLHAVTVVQTPHGDERQSHLKVRVMWRRRGVVADVLVDTGGQVGLVQKQLGPDTCLKISDLPVRLKVANG